MKASQLALPAAAAIAGALVAWLLFVALPGRDRPGPAAAPPPTAAPPESSSSRTIKAQLFYVAEDGVTLAPMERDVPFGENAVDQAKAIVAAQIAPAAAPLVSAIPAGTTLRALFITRDGEAYVDLSPELVSGHPGGSTNELLTIRTLVDVLTTNLPAVSAVQLLVDGRELDTLAGHVDLRRPFRRIVP